MIPEELKWCLEKIEKPVEVGKKCEHQPSSGQWVVRDDDGTFYFIYPSTQLQKNLWMDSAVRTGFISEDNEDHLRRYLRWLCHGCGTIQDA